MNKSPQYNQQTEPKQCKSGVEEICTRPKPGNCHHNIVLQQLYYLIINSGFRAGENPSEATISESSQIRELHETLNF